MGFFNLYKSKGYNYRYIYYDPKKEAQKEREKQREDAKKMAETGEYRPSIKRGTFREMAEKNNRARSSMVRQSNLRLIVILALLIAIAYFIFVF